MLSSGDPGHYCIVCFVHSADNPITETAYDVDTVTPRNRGIGQRNLHIGPPLPASPGPKGGPGMREYIEFYNPYAEPAEYDLLFDFRSLPEALEVRLQFPKIKTVEPLEHAIVGIASRATGDLIGQQIKPRERANERIIELPSFLHQVYTARPSSRVIVQRAMLAPFGKAAAFLSITNTGTLPAGEPLHVYGASERDAVGGWRQHVRGANRRRGERAETVHGAEPRLRVVPEDGQDHSGRRAAVAAAVDPVRAAIQRTVEPARAARVNDDGRGVRRDGDRWCLLPPNPVLSRRCRRLCGRGAGDRPPDD